MFQVLLGWSYPNQNALARKLQHYLQSLLFHYFHNLESRKWISKVNLEVSPQINQTEIHFEIHFRARGRPQIVVRAAVAPALAAQDASHQEGEQKEDQGESGVS